MTSTSGMVPVRQSGVEQGMTPPQLHQWWRKEAEPLHSVALIGRASYVNIFHLEQVGLP